MNAGTTVKAVLAYVIAIAVTYALSVSFYTEQVIAKMQSVGGAYTGGQALDTLAMNAVGMTQGADGQPSYLLMIAVALGLGFLVAFFLKRFLKPLAPIAYPVAGAAAVFTLLWAIETFVAGGGAGAIGGARDALGLSLQAFAGFIGGAAFSYMRPH